MNKNRRTAQAKSETSKDAADKLVKSIRRKTRKQYLAEEKIRIVLAKSVFQLHGADAEGRPALRRQLRRSQMLKFFQRQLMCLIGMESWVILDDHTGSLLNAH